MEYLNLEQYKNWENDPNYRLSSTTFENFINRKKQDRGLYLKKEDSLVIIDRDKDLKYTYIIHKNKNNPYQKTKRYDEKRGHLIFEEEEFYSQYCKIGIEREYDRETGKLIKETNHDAPYKFSIQDLVKKFKNEYNVDLEDVNNEKYQFFVERYPKYSCYPKPYYQVALVIGYSGDEYYVDGTTGKTIFKTRTIDGDKNFCKFTKENGLDK